MNVKIAIIDDVLSIVTIKGEFSIFDEEFDLFAKELVAYTKMGIYRFVIDMEDVNYIDSSGVGLIIRLATKAMKQESRVCVICPQPSVKRVFVVANVDKIINFVETVDDGIKYYTETTDFVPSK